jgi:uncharacterized protein YnzC (UPF0291/DUF896 family)
MDNIKTNKINETDYDNYYNKHRRRELTAEEKERRKEYNRLYRVRKKIKRH